MAPVIRLHEKSMKVMMPEASPMASIASMFEPLFRRSKLSFNNVAGEQIAQEIIRQISVARSGVRSHSLLSLDRLELEC